MNIELGITKSLKGTEPALMDIEELLATRLLVQGNSGSGKSHLIRRMLEQSANKVQQVIIDPEGDFVSLSDEYGHVVVEADRSAEELETIAQRVREHRVSAVLNLESLDVDLQMKAAAIFLNALFDAPRELWYPALVVVDEAQLFAPSAAGEVSDEARRLSLGAMTNLMCRGRKRGLAGVIATQRLAKLAKNVAAEASNFLMGRTFLDIDMARAVDLLGMDKREAEKFRDLQRGHFIALGPALSRRPLPIEIGNVITKPRGATPKLAPPPETTADEAKDLVLAPITPTSRPERRAPTTPQVSTEEVLAAVQTSSIQPNDQEDTDSEAPEAPKVNVPALCRNIANDLMREDQSFYVPEAKLYAEFETLFRIKRLGIPTPSLQVFRKHLIWPGPGIAADQVFDGPWPTALSISEQVPEDLRAIYLAVAKAAIDGAPCPGDATLARICGSMSAGRAVSRIRGLEQAGYIVIREDMRGHRVVQLPDIECETAAGDPKAPDIRTEKAVA